MIARLVFLIGLFLFPNAMTSCSKEEYKTYHHHEKQPSDENDDPDKKDEIP